jgi:hypothetical protein
MSCSSELELDALLSFQWFNTEEVSSLDSLVRILEADPVLLAGTVAQRTRACISVLGHEPPPELDSSCDYRTWYKQVKHISLIALAVNEELTCLCALELLRTFTFESPSSGRSEKSW